MLKHEFLTLVGSVVGIGVALGALLLTTTGRIETRLENAIAEAAADRRAFQEQAAVDRRAFQEQAAADRRAFQEQAAADRRASDAKMEEFRKRMDEHRADMQRLGERQARLEGQRKAGTDQ